jgi:hypothetical protein
MPGVPPIMITGGKNPNGIMHHKFLVSWRETPYGVIPFGAWSGSYNLSQASNNNAENIIILWDHKSAHKYSGEHLALLKVAYKIGKKNHK